MKLHKEIGTKILLLVLLTTAVAAKKDAKPKNTLADYLKTVPQTTVPAPVPVSAGSLWTAGSGMTDLISDYKAHKIGDLLTLSIVEQTTAQASGSVQAQRSFSADSAIPALGGQINTAGMNPLFSLTSNSQLNGKGQTASATTLQTSLTGQVVAMLGERMVVEARRDVFVDNQRQTLLLRGLARPGDVGPNNTVLSTQLSNLEIELAGKGVIGESVRPPNWIIRMALRLIGF
jgi:flagellar L-ring protein precursor FlgH